MKVIYAPDPIGDLYGHSIFMAGPTPRSSDVPSWRPEAIQMFRDLGYAGTLLAPEPEGGEFSAAYEDQWDWENEGLARASVVMFWVPRRIDGGMPAFTTNVEFGLCVGRRRDMVYGRPDWAEKCKYLDVTYRNLTPGEPFNDLGALVRHLVDRSQA